MMTEPQNRKYEGDVSENERLGCGRVTEVSKNEKKPPFGVGNRIKFVSDQERYCEVVNGQTHVRITDRR